MKRLSFSAILLVLCVAGWAQGPDNATPSDQPQGQQGMGQRGGRRGPGVAGEVTAINGNTITVKTMKAIPPRSTSPTRPVSGRTGRMQSSPM